MSNPNFELAEDIQVRRHNGQCAYGSPVDHEDLPVQVIEAINCEIIDGNEEGGMVEVGGQKWEWKS